MMYLVVTVAFSVLVLLVPKPTHAILFLPALILVPIAQIIGVVIAGLTVPALAIGALISTLWKKPLLRTLSISFGILLVLGILIALGLKLSNPDRPLF